MRMLTRTSALFLMVSFIFLSSCSSDDDNQPAPSVSSSISQGSWKITYFVDSGTDETGNFSGYSFQFNTNGTVSATKGGTTVNGTWSDGNDNSHSKLELNFGTVPVFNDLNEDWHVTMQNSTIIKLQHVSGGNGGTDILYFEKI